MTASAHDVPSLLPLFPTAGRRALIRDEQLRLDSLRKEGATCGCCGQHVQAHPRSITRSMARWLVRLARNTKHKAGDLTWSTAKEIGSRGGDYAKLVFWDLIERQGTTRNAGVFRPTWTGLGFVEDRAAVPRNTWVYNNRPIEQFGPLVSISDVVGREGYLKLRATGTKKKKKRTPPTTGEPS